MRFDFELQICVVRSQERITLLVQSISANPTGFCFRFENPMTQVVGFWPSDFKIEKWLSKFKMLSMTANSSNRTIDELDGDKAI